MFVLVCILFIIMGCSHSFGSKDANVLVGMTTAKTVGRMKDCYLYEVYHLESISCNTRNVDDNIVPHGTNCTFRQLPETDTLREGLRKNIGTVEQLICNDGQWSGTDFSVGSPMNRQKRFLGILLGGIVGCFIFCHHHHGTKEPPVYHSPTFESPCEPKEIRDNYNVAAGESVVVSWTDPVASDKDGDKPTVHQSTGIKNGGRFRGSIGGKTHVITYTAVDNTDLKAHCTFSFTVTETTCASPRWPANGHRNCYDFRVGKQCQFQCHNGYELHGHEVLTCVNVQRPSWSSVVPTCKKVTCGYPPTPPANGAVHCTDSTYSYQSYCSISCNKEFSLRGQTFTRCQEDRTWLNKEPTTCIDENPPSLNCKSPQLFYADRGASSTSVTWKIPTATDPTDPAPNVVQTSGPSMGDVISVGSEYVTYMAIDSDGNKAPTCSIELRVQVIACGHPLDTFQDKYLQFNCSGTRYTYGVECKASCLVHLPLEGADKITCEDNGSAVGRWEVMGNGTDPYCKEIACPKLDPPINGALVYDSILTRPINTMVCNEHFDIPYMGDTFYGIFFCTDDGGWQPTDQVPDCTNKNQGANRLRLPGHIFYYKGNCGTKEAIADIEEKFQHILNDKIKPLGVANCPANSTCTAENIVIRCGDIVQARRKRSTIRTKDRKGSVKDIPSSRQKRQAEGATLVVDLDIVVTVTLSDGETILSHIQYYDGVVDALSSAIKLLLNNGSLDIQHFTTQNDSWEAPDSADIVCDAGYVLDGGVCKPCPLGQYLNETSDTCDQCPIGHYSDGEGSIDCISCPTGYSTRKTGSKSLNNCTELCEPGTISPDGMMPCSTCLYGKYQGGVGQSTCIQCPRRTTTLTTNSTSSQDCQNYDVLIEETNGPISLANISSSMTLMFWTKRADEQTMYTTIQLNSDGDARCILNITDVFQVQVMDKLNETIVELPSDTWIHQAVVLNIVDNIVEVYIGGDIKFSSTPPSIRLLASNGELTLTASGQSGLYMTGFYLYDRALTSPEIAKYASSCHVTSNDDVIDNDIFQDKGANGISIVASSKCDSVDNCQPDPCNGHQCIDEQDTFTCHCNSGWSGSTCSIPPDYCTDNQCTNGATCQSGASNYTCHCLQGYSGPMCEIAPVDGGWSEWEITSACTQRCGTGNQTRKRTCDSPIPDLHGADCYGDAEDTIPCNREACEVCKDLPTPSGTLTSCMTNLTTGIRTCQLYCEDDKIMPSGLPDYQEYECGSHTNYEWEHAETLPSCVEPSAPTHLTITTSIEYTTNIFDGDVANLTNSILHNFQTTPCADNCQTSVHVSGTTLTISYSMDLTLGPELHFDRYVAGGTVSGSLQELVNAVSYLERSAQYLHNHTADIFNAIINEVLYTAVTSSLTTEGFVKCPDGQVAYDGACLKCPAGTYLNGYYCTLCEMGTFQPSSGQSECIQCPFSLTTKTIGSSDLSKCSVSLTSPTFIIKQEPTESTSNTTVIVAVVVSIVALVIACLAFALVWYKKRRSMNNGNGSRRQSLATTKDSQTTTPVDPSHSQMNASDEYGGTIRLDPPAYYAIYELPKYTEKDDHPYESVS